MGRTSKILTAFLTISPFVLLLPHVSARAGHSHPNPARQFGTTAGLLHGGYLHREKLDARFRSRQPTISIGASENEVSPLSNEAEQTIEPRCRLERLQFSDEFGWRVRDTMVCRY